MLGKPKTPSDTVVSRFELPSLHNLSCRRKQPNMSFPAKKPAVSFEGTIPGPDDPYRRGLWTDRCADYLELTAVMFNWGDSYDAKVGNITSGAGLP